MQIATEELWRAVADRDARWDGQLFYGVQSTGIYCRPSCPSKRPRPDGVLFFKDCGEAEAEGFRACLRCRPQAKAASADLVDRVVEYLDAHDDEPVKLEELGAALQVSPFHLQRQFKKATGVTPAAYQKELRAQRFSKGLASGKRVTDVVYEAGYRSSSGAYGQAQEELGMSPTVRRKRGEGQNIRYTVTPSEFGELLVASTSRGVCAVRLGDDAAELEAGFRKDFDRADITRDDGELASLVDQILVLINSAAPHPEIPVDVRATAFQRRVWNYLRAIPRGETRTYSQIAADLGAPKSTRAVARACATNEVSLVVPCHRVISVNGNLTGFRWGLDRKRQLLERERS